MLTSPRQRARRTAELAGFPDAVVDADLVEWGYGDYEGITTDEIRVPDPGWTVWTHPTPGGETEAQVHDPAGPGRRACPRRRRAHPGVRPRARAAGPGARWLGLPVTRGRHLQLDTATLSVLAYERESPVLRRWNA